jgi:hypothetical protein
MDKLTPEEESKMPSFVYLDALIAIMDLSEVSLATLEYIDENVPDSDVLGAFVALTDGLHRGAQAILDSEEEALTVQ